MALKCHFSEKNILQVIRNPDLNKVHGHDIISIRMLKVCGETSYVETLWAIYSILKHDIKFSNMILGSVIINFNRFQIFDA